MFTKSIEIKEVKDRTVLFRASDETPDRDGDIILADGWKLENYLKTGAILYGHNPHRFPVGKVDNAYIKDRALYIEASFPKGASPDTDVAYSLIKHDILKAGSVGFRADDWEDRKDSHGRIFKSQELLEFSLTPIPANTNAIALVKEYTEETDKFFTDEERLKILIKETLNEILETKKEEEYIEIIDDEIKQVNEQEDQESNSKTLREVREEKFLELVNHLKRGIKNV
jgi:HK97 family phage prohead protease